MVRRGVHKDRKRSGSRRGRLYGPVFMAGALAGFAAAQAKTSEALPVRKQFEDAWTDADVDISMQDL